MTSVVTGAVVVVEAGLLATLYAAYRRENGAAVANAIVAIGATLVPLAVERLLWVVRGQRVALDPALTLWIAVAGFLHVLGMLGLYESSAWWDHLTHTISAALVASLLYAWLLVTNPTPAGAVPTLTVLGTIGGTLLLGAAWEAIELVAREVAERFDIEPVLVYYGWRDTAFDLVFDVVGALLVVALDLRVFVPVVELLSGA